jgi:protein phosphatase PTC1
MMQVSHGYHVVEDQSLSSDSDEPESDSVVVQREQIEELESWFFGVFDPKVGDEVTKYVRSHLFNRNPKEVRFHVMLFF